MCLIAFLLCFAFGGAVWTLIHTNVPNISHLWLLHIHTASHRPFSALFRRATAIPHTPARCIPAPQVHAPRRHDVESDGEKAAQQHGQRPRRRAGADRGGWTHPLHRDHGSHATAFCTFFPLMNEIAQRVVAGASLRSTASSVSPHRGHHMEVQGKEVQLSGGIEMCGGGRFYCNASLHP